ncbi:hypothetical protein [Moorena sp. SIO3A2]|uniref:hypothetical protein n=1 Tax=Moorena sp. SIO3A2 TaxID=2607841 RepID=UPI0013BD0E85|nr:hypothetical protein [Moorena sp. SIO3A2]NER91555.1 hypothetical protein [Moorena sp. SIO3A2]
MITVNSGRSKSDRTLIPCDRIKPSKITPPCVAMEGTGAEAAPKAGMCATGLTSPGYRKKLPGLGRCVHPGTTVVIYQNQKIDPVPCVSTRSTGVLEVEVRSPLAQLR